MPIKREPEQARFEQCLCIAVPTEPGPSGDLVSGSRASSDPCSPEGSQLHPREEAVMGKEDPGNLAEEMEEGGFPYPEKRRDGTPGFQQPTDLPYNFLYPFQTSPCKQRWLPTDTCRLTPHPSQWFPKPNSNRKLQ